MYDFSYSEKICLVYNFVPLQGIGTGAIEAFASMLSSSLSCIQEGTSHYHMIPVSKLSDAPEIGGTTILGERGQIVIPKNVREDLHLKKGDTFVIMKHGRKMMLIPSDELKTMLAHMTTVIESISKSV